MTTAQKPHLGSAPRVRASTHSVDNRLLSQIGWGVFLLLTGAAWILPSDMHPTAFWFIGLGVLLLALNAVRHRMNIPLDAFGVVAGFIALIAGIGLALNIDLPVFALGLLALGVVVLVRVVFAMRHQTP